MSPADIERLVRLLRGRIGRDQAITSRGICRLLRWPITRERQVRRALSDLECDDDIPEFPLVGIPGIGWWLADSADDWLLRGSVLRQVFEAARLRLSAHNRRGRALGLPQTKTTR